jgi:hypothetical protein
MTAPAALMDCLMGFVRTHALRTAIAVGLPDVLAGRALTAEELAAECAVVPSGMRRLLRCLVEAGAVAVDRSGRHELSAWGQGLRTGTPGSARAYVEYVADVVVPVGRHLPDLVRSGRAGDPFTTEYGRDFFAELAADRATGALFDAAMASTLDSLCGAVAARDWSQVTTVVDVGGGNGRLLAAVLSAHPHLKALLAEQPHVLASAVPVLSAAGTADRTRLVECDFFDAVPAGADAYLLARILHDWDDDSALRILAAVRAAMPPHARLHLVELVLDTDSGWTMAYDLMMGLLLPGHERTGPEWRALLARAGFEVERIEPAGWRGSILTCRAAPRG